MVHTQTHRCYIGLGSNLGGPQQQVSSALQELAAIAGCQLHSHSSLYRSRPVGPGPQPDYINAVAALNTSLTPLALLDALQAIEQAHQRERLERWGPRTLDLDILLYAERHIHNARLTVPHPYLTERSFVLYPLAEIAPQLNIPNAGNLSQLLTQCPADDLAVVAQGG